MSSFRRVLVLLILVACSAVVLAPTASAAITASTVTSPSPGRLLYDKSVDTQGTVSGTVTGSGNVDIRCYAGTTFSTLQSNVSVVGGTFSITKSFKAIADNRCTLRAVPVGLGAGADTSAFSGPLLLVDFTERDTLTTGVPGQLYDYYEWRQNNTAGNDYDSVASCGLCDSRLYDPLTGQQGKFLWYGNAALYGSHGADRAYAMIDGHRAYASQAARNINSNAATQPPVSVTTIRDDTGDMTIHEMSPLSRCPDDTDSPNAVACPAFTPLGVTLDRTYQQTDDGRLIRVSDRFLSTDGQAHDLDLWYDNTQDKNGSPPHPAGQFPWMGAPLHETVAGEAVTAPPAGPGVLYVVRDITAPDGDVANPNGALAFNPAPDGIGYDKGYDFVMKYHRTVPAGGELAIDQSYVMRQTQAEVHTAANAEVDHLGLPQVAISAPADGATVSSPSLTVTGTASDNVGVASVSVNGQAAVLNSGSWSATVTLPPGTSTVTAVGTDGAGNTASASRSVTYTPPPPPAATKLKLVLGSISSKQRVNKAKAVIVKAGCGALACNVTATAKSSLKETSAASTKGNASAGSTTTLKLKISAKTRSRIARALRHHKKVSFTLTLNATATGHPAADPVKVKVSVKR